MTLQQHWKLPEERSGTAGDAALVERRAALIESSATPGLSLAGGDVAVELDAVIGEVPCISCSVAEEKRVIIYFHGGGYRIGAASTWLQFGARLALAAEARVVLVDYRLAPEHPFPAALHDAVNVFDELRASPLQIIAAGDSAGGGLAAALAVACSISGIAPPVGLALISPWVDLTNSSETFDTRAATDEMFSRQAADQAAGLYLQGVEATNPLASPLFADLSGFPPTIIFAGTAEVLLADSSSFAARLGAANVTVESHLVAGMQHVWPTVQPDLVESVEALDQLVRFCRRTTFAE
jgi:monoterpene epsilon-lactone hydrolase